MPKYCPNCGTKLSVEDVSMSKVKKCPKCGGEMMEEERFLFPFVIMAEEPGDKTILFSCKDCGYIELYKEKKGSR